MAQLDGFNANNEQPAKAIEAVPAGWYPAVMFDSGMKCGRDNLSQRLEVKFQITAGQHQNRKVVDWWMISSRFDGMSADKIEKRKKAIQIGRGKLSSCCRAIGIMTPNDSSELHNRIMAIHLKCTKNQKGELENEVSACEPYAARFGAAGGQPAASSVPGVPGVSPPSTQASQNQPPQSQPPQGSGSPPNGNPFQGGQTTHQYGAR